MGKGYAEGPAADERFEALERGDRSLLEPDHVDRPALYGSTPENADRHFIGWLGEVDPDELFAAGKAWGLTIVRRRES